MKKIISFILVAILCLGALTSCDLGNIGDQLGNVGDQIGGFFGGLFGEEEPEGPTVEQAASYLDSIYKNSAGQKDTEDYELVAKVVLDGQYVFDVTWTVNNSSITIKASSETGYCDVDLPASNDTEVEYTLTATIKDADGNTATYSLSRKLGKYQEKVEVDSVTTLVEGVAYKFYLTQNELRQHLFATHSIDQGKFYVGTTDYTAAPDFFAEKVDGGYKFYTMIEGAKKYVNAYVVEDGVTDSGATKYSKRLNYTDTTDNVWVYDTDAKCWCVTLNEAIYGIGTYGAFNTFSISEYSYFSGSNSSGQYRAGFVTIEQAANLPAFPALSTTEAPEVNKGYHIVTQNKDGDIYFNGTVDGGRFSASADKANAAVVFVKAGANANEYILCLYIDNVANYVVIADNSQGAALTTNVSEATVFEWNSTKATMVVALDSNNRAFGTDSTKTYESMSTYDASGSYSWGAFQLVEGATEPENPSAPPETPDQGGDDTPSVPTTITAVKPVVGTEYIMGLTQGNIDKILYLTSNAKDEVNTWYRATTTDPSAAVKVSIEAVDGVDGAFRITYTVGTTKYYLEAYERDATEGKGSIQIMTTPTEGLYYTFDETYNIPVVTVGSNKYYLGTYNTFDTISCSNYSYLSAESVNTSNFILVFVDPNASSTGGSGNTDSGDSGSTPSEPTSSTLIDATIAGSVTSYLTYISNNPTEYPNPSFYNSGAGGLKCNFPGIGVQTVAFAAQSSVKVTFNIAALNNKTTGTEDATVPAFTITGLDADGNTVATATLNVVVVGDNSVVLTGEGIVSVKIIMTDYPVTGEATLNNANLAGVKVEANA